MPVIDLHGAVDRETGVAPGQAVADRLFPDETLVHERPQDLGLKEAFEVARVEAWQLAEAPIGAEAAIGDEDVNMGVEVEQLASRLEETHGAGCYFSAVEDLFPHLREFATTKTIVGFDLVEYNPFYDNRGQQTARLARLVMLQFLTGIAMKKEGIDPRWVNPRISGDP